MSDNLDSGYVWDSGNKSTQVPRFTPETSGVRLDFRPFNTLPGKYKEYKAIILHREIIRNLQCHCN